MKKSTKDLFKRLDESRKSKGISAEPTLRPPYSTSYPHLESFLDGFTSGRYASKTGRSQTLGSFADQLRISVDLLIRQFDEAGVRGLTSDHLIDSLHKDALLAHLRKKHAADTDKSETLYQNEFIRPSQIELVQDINEELLFHLSRDPALMYQLAPRKFEEMVARLFEGRGYRVTLTPQTRDGGYDIFAELHDSISSFLVMAECKRYQRENKVGVEVVRGLYGVTEARRANQGLVITSSFFTKDAMEEKRLIGARIGLKDYNDLVEWLRPYSGSA